MTTYEMTLKRRSVRKFTDRPIDDASIDLLLKSAMAAPSACNKQPWEFYVVKNGELQEKLRHASKFTNMNSSLIIIVAGNTQRSLSRRDNDFWIQDCSAAIENLLLTATELEIGSCWCGLYPMEPPVRRVREILGLSEDIIPLALIHLGYFDGETTARTQYQPDRVHILE